MAHAFPYFEHMYLKAIHNFLTERWWTLQGAVDDVALQEWILVLKILEVDTKARRDMFLLAQSGQVGRTHASKILWQLLSGHALDPACVDLSSLVTHEVYKARKNFDRPPSRAQGPAVLGVVLLRESARVGPEMESWTSALRDLVQKGW